MANLITFRYLRDGVPSLGASAVTLSLVRDSDGLILLPAFTAPANPSAGVYTYDPTALMLSTSLSYSVTWAYTDDSGVHQAVDKIESQDTSKSLLAYRQNVQYELGRLITGTTTVDSVGTSDLICAELIDSAGSVNTFDGWFVYITSGVQRGQERTPGRAGFTPSTGTITVSRPYSEHLSPNIEFELANRLPATSFAGVRGVNYAINWALQRTWFRDRIALTPVTNQRFYSLGPWMHWFTSELRLGRVYQAAVDALSNPYPHPGGASLRLDGELPMLELDTPFSDTDSVFYVEVMRPGHTWCQSGGAWSETTQGLLQDSDQALISPNIVTQLALVECYQQLANTSVGNDRIAWLGQRTLQAAGCAKLRTAMLDEFPQGAATANRRLTPYPSFRF